MSKLHFRYVTRFVVLTEPINAWPRLIAKLSSYVQPSEFLQYLITGFLLGWL